MKRKVLVFASTFPRWKNDTLPPFIYELSKRLTNEFDVSILTPNYPGAKQDEIMDKMKVHRFNYFLKKYQKLAGSGGILPTLKKNKWFYFQVPFFMIGEFFALKKQIKENRPDIIHAHWIIPQGIASYLNYKIYGVPYVITTHGGDIFGLQGNIPTYIKKIVLRNAKKITVVSNAIKKEMHEKIDLTLKIDVISMGVDSKKFNPSKKDNSIKKKYKINGPFLLFVGRLAEKKGVEYLIKAIPNIIKKFPKTKLMIIGAGTLEKELKEQTKKLKLENKIIFTGAIPNTQLPKYYATSDVFIGPSIEAKDGDREGLPVTLMEAMSSGSMIIATDLEGNMDLIKDKCNGFLVKQKNSQDVSDKIIKLLDNKKLFGNIKREGIKEIKKRFDWDVIGKKYLGVLR